MNGAGKSDRGLCAPADSRYAAEAAEAAELDALLAKVHLTPSIMTADQIGLLCEQLSTQHFEVVARVDSVGGNVAVLLHREDRRQAFIPHYLRRPALEESR
ncbi:MAG: hypothetical protein H0W33_03610 [Gammaproteobacteria bacterium]|nr:hypothetical protein [Gammaproteobacteria bacterium]